MSEPLYQAYLKGVLKLSATGIWYHNGSPFTNQKVIDLFFRSIVWNEDHQEYVVRIGLGEARFDCEDTAYFITRVDDSNVPWQLTISDGSQEQLQPEFMGIGSEGQVYCTIKKSHRARFTRKSYQQLALHFTGTDSIKIGSKVHQIGVA